MYVLQKINTSIFKKPISLIENIELTADFLKVLGQASLELVKSNDGDSFIEYNSGYGHLNISISQHILKLILFLLYQKAQNVLVIFIYI